MLGTSKPTGQSVVFPFGFGIRSTVRMRANWTRKRSFRRVRLQPHRRLQQGSTCEEPDTKNKNTASKPKAAKYVTGEHTDESNADEEEESEEEEEEEPPVSQGKSAKKDAARPESEESRARFSFKQPARQSTPREPPAKQAPKGKTSVAKSLGANLATAAKKK